MTLLTAAICGAASAVGFLIVISTLLGRRRRSLISRVAPHVTRVSSAARAAALARNESLWRDLSARRWRDQLQHLGDRHASVARRLGSLTQSLTRIESTDTAEVFVLRMLGTSALGCLLGLVTGWAWLVSGASASALGTATLAGAILGVAVPLVRLRQRDRSVRASIISELPVALGFVVIALRAGETLPRSLERVARAGKGRLTRELGIAVDSLGVGARLEDTLKGVSARLAMPEVSQCLDAMVAALISGAPVAESLALRVEELSARQSQRRIERASRQEVGMLIPLVFLVLPVTVVFAVLPGLLALNAGLW